jgi:GNAT superfamily N-acetyltransferase
VPAVRKLWQSDLPEITRHLLRLDPETRRLRFGAVVSDSFLGTYAKGILKFDSVDYGAFPDGQLRAVGELRGLYQSWPRHAELALSVEVGWQSQGIGTALFSRLVAAAQNRNISSLHVLFMNENNRMRKIAAKHHPGFDFHGTQVEARLHPPWPTPLSIGSEIVEDTSAYVRQVFMQAR